MNNAIKQEATVKQEALLKEIEVLNRERPLFEANYVLLGGSLQFLKWEECDNGTGTYQPDWEAISDSNISESNFDEEILEHSNIVDSCLHSWVECAKSKAIPDGWVLAPKEPIEKQKKAATLVTLSGGNAIDAYKTMLNVLDDLTQ